MFISVKQLKEAIDFIDPDNDPDNEYQELGFLYKNKEFTSIDGDLMPKGLYCYLADYPEEGIHYLDNEDNCPKCSNPWGDHEFGVPEPYCP
jgi:hypothetical protein